MCEKELTKSDIKEFKKLLKNGKTLINCLIFTLIFLIMSIYMRLLL